MIADIAFALFLIRVHLRLSAANVFSPCLRVSVVGVLLQV
jgi:hypothetical protein